MIRVLSLLCATLSLLAGAAVADCKLMKVADLPVTMIGYPLVEASVNGTKLRFIADSGAFFSAISPAMAAQLHLNTYPAPFGFQIQGLGGVADTEIGRAKDFEIAGATLHGIDFLVAGNGPGPGVAGLIGQNILGFADVEYDLANGMIRLWRPVGCGDRPLAYWLTKDQHFGRLDIEPVHDVHHTIGVATINGHQIRATFDTGVGRSYVLKAAAQRAGVAVTGPDVVEAAPMVGGVGLKTFRTFIAPVQSFGVGGEDIQNTHLRIGEANLTNSDMLIGADFFLSHRIYVSNAQRRMYFTYNGGPVFDVSLAAKAGAILKAAPAVASTIPDTGLDASALARRGDASAARGDYQGAIADLTRARAAAPNDADVAFDRARTYARLGQESSAMADADDALRLQPDHVLALILRAKLWLAKPDKARALADIDAAARIVSKASDAHMALADLYVRAGAPQAAIGHYDLWLQNHPADVQRATAYKGRCWARAILGEELPNALADCDAALRGNSKASQVLDSRGLVHLRLGQFDKAIADYSAALAINPKIAWSLYGRGLARSRLGRGAEGMADIAAATALDPKLPAIAKGYGLTP
jgi:tetratricopeptide (TPR) repeat protein/predicted aspartyl protease